MGVNVNNIFQKYADVVIVIFYLLGNNSVFQSSQRGDYVFGNIYK